MNKSIEKRIREFVEQENKVTVNVELQNRLQRYLAADTLYWQWPAEQRKAINEFLRIIVDEYVRSTLSDEYGAMIVLEGLVVTAFEVGYRFGKDE